MSIEEQLNLKFPISWNSWPIEEEFAIKLVEIIKINKPTNVVELGSGTSTLIILKTLNMLGVNYTLTSVDSDPIFLAKTKALLISEGVYDDKKVKLIFSPVRDMIINNLSYKWYNPVDFEFDSNKIDLLFVDGPVGGLCKNCRYPAVGIFKKNLRDGSIVILHDSKRPDEIEIISMWTKENPEIKSVRNIETERGGVEIKF